MKLGNSFVWIGAFSSFESFKNWWSKASRSMIKWSPFEFQLIESKDSSLRTSKSLLTNGWISHLPSASWNLLLRSRIDCSFYLFQSSFGSLWHPFCKSFLASSSCFSDRILSLQKLFFGKFRVRIFGLIPRCSLAGASSISKSLKRLNICFRS